MKDKCNRCTQCCHYIFKGKLKACKYLKGVNCIKYPNHRGTILERNLLIICKSRIKSNYNFKNCPYNEDTPTLEEVNYL